MIAAEIVVCSACGQKNRVRAAATGVPHCAKCGRPLPWLAETTAAEFRAAVEESPLPVLIDFWAPWCAPCRIVAPVVKQLATDLAGKLKVVKVNTDEVPELGTRFEVRGIPTLVLFDGGKQLDRVTGALPGPQLRSWVESRLRSKPGATPNR